MATRKCECKTDSVYAFLYKNRTPFAKATLIGTQKGNNESAYGIVEFFSTPLGILVHAELCALPKQRKMGVYNFCVRDIEKSECGGNCNKRSLCRLMPIAYEKDGKADCSILTRRISPSDLIGKRISVYERRRGCPKEASLAIVSGDIECF